MKIRRIITSAAGLLMLTATSVHAVLVDVEFITNGSFESIPDCTIGCTVQGLMPADWDNVPIPGIAGADTYSDDGSYGLDPAAAASLFNNGQSALDGIRFVAAAAAGSQGGFASEGFGQQLANNLIVGETYSVSASLLQPNGLGFTGGYNVYLGTGLGQGLQLVGFLGSTTFNQNGNNWVGFSFDFEVTALLAGLDYLQFMAIPDNGINTYLGIDMVSMIGAIEDSTDPTIPEPGSLLLVGIGIAGLRIFRTRAAQKRTDF